MKDQHFSSIFDDIDLKIVDLLIEREKKDKERQKQQQSSYIQLPAPQNAIFKPSLEENDEKKDNNGAIVIDL